MKSQSEMLNMKYLLSFQERHMGQWILLIKKYEGATYSYHQPLLPNSYKLCAAILALGLSYLYLRITTITNLGNIRAEMRPELSQKS